MTIEEYRLYSDVAFRIFNYMNGRINTLNRYCKLEICMYDNINGTLGNINYPDHVSINIGTIIDCWRDKWSKWLNRHDYICTCISWTLSHELHHADQLISMVKYNENKEYKCEVEGDVERASYDWVLRHSSKLSKVGNFNVVLRFLTSETMPKIGHYSKPSVKDYYLQTIANVIIRDLDLFNTFNVFKHDQLSDTIILEFQGQDQVVIKSNKKYLKENIDQFNILAYKWAGYYDRYSIQVISDYLDERNKVVLVKFIFSDMTIKPFETKE